MEAFLILGILSFAVLTYCLSKVFKVHREDELIENIEKAINKGKDNETSNNTDSSNLPD